MLAKKIIVFTVFVSLCWATGAFAEIKEGLWEAIRLPSAENDR